MSAELGPAATVRDAARSAIGMLIHTRSAVPPVGQVPPAAQPGLAASV